MNTAKICTVVRVYDEKGTYSETRYDNVSCENIPRDIMKELLDGGTTVIFVSHSIDQVKRMCNKATWLEKGKVIMTGDAETVCDAYSQKY